MDIYELTQIMIVITTGLVFGRLGLALARRIERRPAGTPDHAEAERLRAVEDECAQLRREVAELQERQDFTERLLARGADPEGRPPAREPRVATPH
ncbi:MAG TPA: hypothetical protein VEB59_10620 [Gemmatimonadales bacterium]|nr:hypothetical protein [Gemmatimonadales bacterium]